MLCPNCGEYVQEDQKFCNHCGTKLKAITLAPNSEPDRTVIFDETQSPNAATLAGSAVNLASPNTAFAQAYQEVHAPDTYPDDPLRQTDVLPPYTATNIIQTDLPGAPAPSYSETWTESTIPLAQPQSLTSPAGAEYTAPVVPQSTASLSASYPNPPIRTDQQRQQSRVQQAAFVRNRIDQYPSIGKYLMQERFFEANSENHKPGFLSRMPSSLQLIGIILIIFALIILANYGTFRMMASSNSSTVSSTTTETVINGTLLSAKASGSRSPSPASWWMEKNPPSLPDRNTEDPITAPALSCTVCDDTIQLTNGSTAIAGNHPEHQEKSGCGFEVAS